MAKQITDLTRISQNEVAQNDLMFLRDMNQKKDKSISIEDLVKTIALSFYSVGDYFITKSSVNPAQKFGGSWEKVKGKFLVGVDEEDTLFNIAGATGGSKTTTLTGDQLPEHGFDIRMHGDGSATTLAGTSPIGAMRQERRSDWGIYRSGGPNINGANSVGYVAYKIGRNQPHSNLPPYEAVNIWRRVA